MRSKNFTLTPNGSYQSVDITITEGDVVYYPMSYLIYNACDDSVNVRLIDSDFDDITNYPNSFAGIILQSGNEYPMSGTTHVDSFQYKLEDATSGNIVLSTFDYKRRG